MTTPEMKNLRAVVIGTSCSGKTTFARQLARIHEAEHIELDQLHWLPNWQERSTDDFRALVENAIEEPAWVVDGNYSKVRDLVWPRANTIIWLNYPFPLVLYRSLKRSIGRAATKEPLFAGNVESFRRSFFSHDSIILWVMKTHHARKSSYAKLLKRHQAQGVLTFEFQSPRQADRFLGDTQVGIDEA